MNPCAFFLWGVMKDQVYRPMPNDLEDLKLKITHSFQSIPRATVQKAVLSMMSRAKKLVIAEGKGFEGKKIVL